MKLIVDIQDFVYNNVKEFDTTHNYELNIVESIKNGTPLSEELEKLKSEIHKLAFDDGEYMGIIDNDDIMDLIDNYITELKGGPNAE